LAEFEIAGGDVGIGVEMKIFDDVDLGSGDDGGGGSGGASVDSTEGRKGKTGGSDKNYSHTNVERKSKRKGRTKGQGNRTEEKKNGSENEIRWKQQKWTNSSV